MAEIIEDGVPVPSLPAEVADLKVVTGLRTDPTV